MYKKFITGLLLIPCFTTCNTDQQIQDLKNKIKKTDLEVSKQIATIYEIESIIDSLVSKAQNLVLEINNQLDEGESERFRSEIISFQMNFQNSIENEQAIRDLIKNDLTDTNKKNALELKRLKYLLIRYVIEYINLKKEIEQFEQLIQTSLILNIQLEQYEKYRCD